MEKKALIFDMDGTIADLYNVKNWLVNIENENSTPYRDALPLYDMKKLNIILTIFKQIGYSIVVTTWLANNKNNSKEFDEQIRKEKIAWLKKYNFPYDEIHIIQYGTTKANCTRTKYDYQILIDDNDKILQEWSLGDTIDSKTNIVEPLINLLYSELSFLMKKN